MKHLHGKLTYANVIATLALFLVLAGGTAFAASQFGKETIAGRAIKKESIGPGKLTPAAKAALEGSAGPKGATGATGATGPAGSQGPAGAAGATKIDVQHGPQAFGSFAHCPAGQVAVGGGGEAVEGFFFVSQPVTGEALTPSGGRPDGWYTKAEEPNGTPGDSITYVLCASP
jgi:hypothetical protein